MTLALFALLALTVTADPPDLCERVAQNAYRTCAHGYFGVEGKDKTEGPAYEFANVACSVAATVAYRSCGDGSMLKHIAKNGGPSCTSMGVFYQDIISYACNISDSEHKHVAEAKQCSEKWSLAGARDFVVWCLAQKPEDQPIPENPNAKPQPKPKAPGSKDI